jgi:4-hydroxy-4-methyl-2-oxoglutarate aldolase
MSTEIQPANPTGQPTRRVVVRSLVRTTFERPPPEWVAEIALAEVAALSELVGAMYTMGNSIRPFAGLAFPVTGVVTTAKCPPGDNLGLVKALSLVQPGDVLVVDAQGFEQWCLGGFQLLQYARDTRGLAGLVVNGAYRDVAEAQQAKFPIYATGVASYSGPKDGPCEVNVPVCCGGVVVHAGDVVSASIEGVVVVPQRSLQLVLDAMRQRQMSVGHTPDLLRSLFKRAENLDCDLLPGVDPSARTI